MNEGEKVTTRQPGNYSHAQVAYYLEESERLNKELHLLKEAELKAQECCKEDPHGIWTRESIHIQKLRVLTEAKYLEAFEYVRGWSAVQELYPQE